MPTPQELAARIEKAAAQIPIIFANGEVIAMNEILSNMMRRIFNEGKRTDGGQIGQYSTKKMLVGASSFRNKTAANRFFSKKNKKELEWVYYKNRALAVMKGGYKELREIQGLESNYVNLQYRDNLINSIDIGVNRFANIRVEGSTAYFDDATVIGVTTEKAAIITSALDKKYGQVFYPSEEEINIGVTLMTQYITEQLKAITATWAL